MSTRSKYLYTIAPMLLITACGTAERPDSGAEEDVRSAHDAMYLEDDQGYWFQSPAFNTVPVCWRNPSNVYSAEKQIIQGAIQSSWQSSSALTFTGWGTCPQAGKYMSVEIFDDQTGGGIKGRVEPEEYGLLSLHDVATETQASVTLRYDLTGPDRTTDQQIRNLAYHEFGHALGFQHENDREDAGDCYTEPTIDLTRLNDLGTTEVDPWSIMAASPCRAGVASGRRPSGTDLLANQLIHGSPSRWTHATRNFCVGAGETLYIGDFNGDGRDDLLCNQSDGDMLIDHANENGEFWSSNWVLTGRNFCVQAGEKLYVGDFNGDGRDDLLCNQSDGDMLIDHANENGEFWSSNWVLTGRNFCAQAGEKLYVGDFNGDGRDDLLCNQSDDGEMLIDHANANGEFWASDWSQIRSFCHASGKLLVADFTGDGRDDLACFNAATGFISFELADGNGRFDDMDLGVPPAPQPDAGGPLAAWCAGGTLLSGQFNSASTGGRVHLPGRADLLCQKSSGSMSLQYDFSMPALSEASVSVSAGGWVHYGPFTVASGGELNALLGRPIPVGGLPSANADLYVKQGSQPTEASFDCKSDGSTSFERCSLPGPGNYYVSVRGVTAASGLTVQVFLESFGIFTSP